MVVCVSRAIAVGITHSICRKARIPAKSPVAAHAQLHEHSWSRTAAMLRGAVRLYYNRQKLINITTSSVWTIVCEITLIVQEATGTLVSRASLARKLIPETHKNTRNARILGCSTIGPLTVLFWLAVLHSRLSTHYGVAKAQCSTGESLRLRSTSRHVEASCSPFWVLRLAVA